MNDTTTPAADDKIMTRRAGLAALAGAVAAPVLAATLARAQDMGRQDPAVVVPGQPRRPGMTGGQMDGDYATQTLMLGTLSLEASKLAQQKAQNQDVKKFAELEAAEQKTVADVLKANGAPAMTAADLPADMKQKMQQMQQMDGKQFDSAYVQDQMQVHQQLLDLQQQKKGEPLTEPTSVLAHLGIDAIKSHMTLLEMIQQKMM